jgi:lipopolysaccharide biosynthesis regulator YciM
MGAAVVIVLVALGALAAGILIGRYYVPDDRLLRRTARHSRAYMRALNHLIARDHDTVIKELREVVEENIEEIEPYFALGALFRGRGEHERAIRVHQALAVREGGSRKHRVRALFELGLDFRTAGMPRRSARAMEEVLVEEPRHESALRALCGLYEEQGRYLEAAQVWQRLAKLHGEAPSGREHHLWIAAAQTAIAAGDLDSGKRLLKDARRGHDESAHFHAAAAELAAARGNPRGSRDRLRQAILAAPELTRFFVPGLVTAERELAAKLRSKGDGAGDAGAATSDELDDFDVATPPPPPPPTDAVADAAALAAGTAPAALPAATSPSTALVPAAPAALAKRKDDTTGPSGKSPATSTSLPPRPVSDAEARKHAAATLAELETEAASPVPIALARAELLSPSDPAAALAIHDRLGKDHADLLPTRVTAARLALADATTATDRITAELRALTAVLGWTTDGRWRCAHCGRRSPDFAWRCAGCRRWSTARVDLGGEPPAAPPRERRERPRDRGDLSRPALLGDSAASALPAPSLDHGLADDELARSRTRPSLLGRVGGWFSGAWSGMRGKRRPAD